MVDYSCKLCSYSTENRNNFTRHIVSAKHLEKVHHSEHENVGKMELLPKKFTPRFKCDFCENTFSRDYNKKRHIQKYHITNMRPNGNQNFLIEKKNKKKRISVTSSTNFPPTSTDFFDEKKNEMSQGSIFCTVCKKRYSRSDSLKRHMERCHVNEFNNLKEIVKLEKYKTRLKYKDKELHNYKREVSYYKKLLDMAEGITNRAMSSTSHIVRNHDSAPPLEKLRMKNLDHILKIEGFPKNVTENNFIDKVIASYNSGIIGQFLGDLIINTYKKQDPSQQSIWATDASRQTYLIKKSGSDDSSRWIVDKKGNKTIKYIIDPIIKKIEKLTDDYHLKHVPDLSDPNVDIRNLDQDHIIFVNELCGRFKKDMNDKKIHREVLKYISSHLHYNKQIL